MHLTGLTISPLGLELTGTMPIDSAAKEHSFFYDRQAPTVTLVLRDGTIVKTAARGSSLSSGGTDAATAEFSIEYEFQAGSESRRFLKTETIAAVRIDQFTISIDE